MRQSGALTEHAVAVARDSAAGSEHGAASTCPVCATADLVCGKWTLLIVHALAADARRFCELEQTLAGISPRTLSVRLRALEEAGLVARVRRTPDGAHAYALTDMGRELLPVIEAMERFGRRWLGGREGPCGER